VKVQVPGYMQLRPIVDGDHEWLIELHNDPAVLRNVTHPQPITLQQHLAWWEGIRANQSQLRMIFEVNGERAGLTKFYDLDFDNNCCVLGGDIHKDQRGNGYAKLMWALMLNKCFDEFYFNRVALSTAEFNAVARHVYQGLGFKYEGQLTQGIYRDGQYYDLVLMYMLRDDWSSP